MKGKHFFLFGIFLLLLNDANAATTIDGGSFDTIYDAFKTWIGGSLGLTIALLGTIGVIIVLMFDMTVGVFSGGNGYITPSWYFKMGAMSFFIGGVVGIIEMMANLGRSTFG